MSRNWKSITERLSFTSLGNVIEKVSEGRSSLQMFFWLIEEWNNLSIFCMKSQKIYRQVILRWFLMARGRFQRIIRSISWGQIQFYLSALRASVQQESRTEWTISSHLKNGIHFLTVIFTLLNCSLSIISTR